MKTMYINDGYDGEPSNKDEVFQRLKRINQHMYRPPKESSDASAEPEPRTSH